MPGSCDKLRRVKISDVLFLEFFKLAAPLSGFPHNAAYYHSLH
jgi:hypothetical protein